MLCQRVFGEALCELTPAMEHAGKLIRFSEL